MPTKLILIHGRNQQGKDPVELKRYWFEALTAGFDRLGLESPVEEADVIFPFFGDALHELTREESLDEADAVMGDAVVGDETASEADETVQFGREVLGEVLDASGVSAEAIDAELDPDVIDEAAIEDAKGRRCADLGMGPHRPVDSRSLHPGSERGKRRLCNE